MDSRRRTLAAVAIVLLAAAYTCVDLARDATSYGSHDWDAMESYRHFAVTSLVRFREFPFWDPYSCGGFPYWAAPESGTTIVSPLLPVFLHLPLTVALRIEIVFTLAVALAGTWAVAGRVVSDPILKAGVCLVAVLNSRWAQQAAAGHTWHLYYAWVPWVVWSYFRLLDAPPPRRAAWVGLTSALLALMVYTGGIYPLPHVLLALGLYAIYVGAREKRWAPLRDLALVASLAWALAAPKLLPVVDTMIRFPRHVTSREYLDPISYVLTFVSPEAWRKAWPYWDLDYGFHEYGIYIGVVATAAVVVGTVRAPPDPQVRALRFVGLGLFWLSLGIFGPWLLLHQIPPFRSQHVPQRFAYPGLLFLATVAAAAIEQKLAAVAPERRRALGGVLVALTLVVAADLARESRSCLARGFGVRLPEVVARARYEQTWDVPADLAYPESNGPAGITVHQAGVGTILCGTFHGYNPLAWGGPDRTEKPLRLGATGIGAPDYRGEVYVDGAGEARFVEWTPNRMVVEVHGARPGDHLVLNQNWDESWRANGAPTVDHGHVNAYAMTASDERVEFRYRPRTLSFALAMPLVWLAAIALTWARGRAKREAR